MKRFLFSLLISPALILPAFLNQNVETKDVSADVPQYNIPVEAGEELDTANTFYDGFNNGIDYDNWYLNKRAWSGDGSNGRHNGGVTPQNVFYDSQEGTAILRTTGDYYTAKDIDRVRGGSESILRGTRTGADLVTKFKTYPGRYEVRMKVAPRFGVCSTMWTYIEYKDNNDKAQNHEIDIELPYEGNFRKVSFGHYASLSKHTSKKVLMDEPLNDDEYHTYGFDWYYNDNTGLQKINYYIDGVIYFSSTQNVPFYATKLNIGIWVPDSVLAGTPPRYDYAFADIDYFKYIPFKNNHHEDSPYTSSYNMSSVATQGEYPTSSTHLTADKRNYFPNGSFGFVNTLNNDLWYESGTTGLVTNNVTFAKQYDYQGSSTSGGASISSVNGSLTGYIDSCHFGQNYHISTKYKGSGQATLTYFDAEDQEISNVQFDIENSDDWATFEQNCAIIANTAYISIKFSTNGATLLVDDVFVTLGIQSIEPTNSTLNHSMVMFHMNSEVLNKMNTNGSSTSAKVENLILNNPDPTSDIDWRMSIGKYEVKSGDAVNSITMGSESNNIASSSDATYASILSAITSEVGISGIQAALHSTNTIKNIRDLSIFWGSVEAGAIYIVYKLEGESNWKYLNSFSATQTNQGSGDKNTWNRRQLIIDNSNEDFVNKVLGRNAAVGFVFSSNSTNPDVSYIRLNGFYVNKIESIKAKINYWSENNTNLCGVSGAFFNTKSQEYFDLLMTNYGFNTKQANDLNVELSNEGSAKELTYYDQYVYLCNHAGITVSVQPTNSNVIGINIQNSSYVVLVTISASIIFLAALVGLIIIKKRFYR